MSEALLEIVEPIIADRLELLIADRAEQLAAERERMIEIQIRKEAKEEVAKAKEEAAKVKEEATKVKEEGIKAMVEILHDLGNDNGVIRAAIKKQYHLPEEEVSKYL